MISQLKILIQTKFINAFAVRVVVFLLVFSGINQIEATAQTGICIIDSLSIIGAGSQMTIFSDSVYLQNSSVKGEGVLAIDNTDKEETTIFAENSAISHLKIIQNDYSKVNLEGDLLITNTLEIANGTLEVGLYSSLDFSPSAIKILGNHAQILYRHDFSWHPIVPINTSNPFTFVGIVAILLQETKLTLLIPFHQTITIQQEISFLLNACLHSIYSPPEI
jgi:hypothetical protein